MSTMRLFEYGELVATPAALRELEGADEDAKALIRGTTLTTLLARHLRGDWGEACPHDWKANDAAVRDGDSRIMSVYELPNEVRIWIITEADRSSTTILLPEEY